MALTVSLLKSQLVAASISRPTCIPRLLLAVSVIILFGAGLGSSRMFTYHESFTAQGAREMLATGDWLIPRVGGMPWLEKPPLPQWLAAIGGYLLGSVDEFASRLPAAIFGFVGVMMFAGVVSRCRGERIGLITGIVLATSTSIITYARLAEPDIYLWGIILAALSLFAEQNVESDQPRSRKVVLGFYILLGLTQTVKGPLFGAVLTLAPCGVWLMVHRFSNWKWFVSPMGWLLAAVIALAWPVAVVLQFPEALDLWRSHTLGRLDAATAYNPKPIWYYFTTLPWQAAPAFLLALPALPRAMRHAIQQPKSLDRFLMVWFVSMFALLSVASAKHHHYLIHALPPIAYWATQGLPWYRDRVAWLWSHTWYRRLSPIVLGAMLGVTAWKISENGTIHASEILVIGFATLAGLTVMAIACYRRNDVVAATALMLILIGGSTFANVMWLGRNDIYAQDAALARRLETCTELYETILVYKIIPARMLLDMDRKVIMIDSADDLRKALQTDGPRHILTVLHYREELQSLATLEEIDRTPDPKWPGLLLSHTVVYRASHH